MNDVVADFDCQLEIESVSLTREGFPVHDWHTHIHKNVQQSRMCTPTVHNPMTVCGGPREENPMCVEENPTGSDCCCPWPRKCLHPPLQKLSACFASCILSFIPLYHL